MKGFIEVIRPNYVGEPSTPMLLAVKAILKVTPQGDDLERTHITLSLKDQRYEDGPLENQSYTVAGSFEEIVKKIRIATGEQLPH